MRSRRRPSATRSSTLRSFSPPSWSITICSLSLAAALITGCDGRPRFKSTDITGADYGKTLELTDQTGRPRRLEDWRGKVVVLFFGFTHCPDVCPTTLADLSQVMKQLGPDAERVQVLFVTVDPERDTPEVLGKYVGRLRPEVSWPLRRRRGDTTRGPRVQGVLREAQERRWLQRRPQRADLCNRPAGTAAPVRAPGAPGRRPSRRPENSFEIRLGRGGKRLAHLQERLRLDLADALGRHVEFRGELVQGRAVLLAQPAGFDDAAASRVEEIGRAHV